MVSAMDTKVMLRERIHRYAELRKGIDDPRTKAVLLEMIREACEELKGGGASPPCLESDPRCPGCEAA